MFHATLFALLGGMFLLFAFSAGRADQIVVAVASALIALWLCDSAVRAGRGARRRRRAARTSIDDTDGRQ